MAKYITVPVDQIPLGLCGSNCGGKTNIFKGKGRRRGQYSRYISGHNPSVTPRAEGWETRKNKDHRPCACGGWRDRSTEMCRDCWNKDGKPPEDPNTYLIHGQLRRRIPLSQDKYTWIYACDYDRLSSYFYYAQYNPLKRGFYAVRTADKCRQPITNDVLKVPDGMLVDHTRTLDTLNNCRDNLRLADSSQNAMNRHKHTNNTSTEKNIRVYPNGECIVRICVKGVTHTYGRFASLDEARVVRDRVLHEHHGEFANTGDQESEIEHSDNWLKHAVIVTIPR